MKYQVRSPSDALLYLADCQLATVDSLAMKKSRAKHDYERQKSIAQTAVDYIKSFGIEPNSTRVKNVIEAGSVDEYVKAFEA